MLLLFPRNGKPMEVVGHEIFNTCNEAQQYQLIVSSAIVTQLD